MLPARRARNRPIAPATCPLTMPQALPCGCGPMAFASTAPPPPAWRLVAWLTTSPEQVPSDVLTILRGRLVVGIAPLIVAAVVGTALASLALLRVPTAVMLGWFCADLALTLVRLTTMLVMRRTLRRPRQRSGRLPLTDLYVLSSLLWCAQIGCGVGLCMASGDSVLVPFACLATTGLVGGLAARNPGAPRMTLVQMISVVVPFTAGAIASGQPWFLPLCALAPLYLVAVAAVNRRLHADYVALLCAERALRHQALHCGLTGLPNRASFNQALTAVSAGRKDDEEHAVALLYLDLDGFKAVNDTYGHAAGDVLLQQVGGRLREVVMAADVVARLGGDEFAVLLTGRRAASAERVAGAIIAAVGMPYDLDHGTRVGIGVSVGIAECDSCFTDSYTLLVRADRALYTAKRRGKGTFHRARTVKGDGGRTARVTAEC